MFILPVLAAGVSLTVMTCEGIYLKRAARVEQLKSVRRERSEARTKRHQDDVINVRGPGKFRFYEVRR